MTRLRALKANRAGAENRFALGSLAEPVRARSARAPFPSTSLRVRVTMFLGALVDGARAILVHRFKLKLFHG
jgi:hypothetical protein